MTGAEVVAAEAQAPATQPTAVELHELAPQVLIARMQAVERVVREVMQPGIHYGPIPGHPNENMLEKPGTEVLAATFGLALEYEIEADLTPDGAKRYTAQCRVTHQGTGQFLGSGIGYASTLESAFHWREAASRKEYEATAADRRREKFKRGGGVILQVVEEPEDKANTIIKMAAKRAASDAVQSVLGVRGMILSARAPAQRRDGVSAEELAAVLKKAAAKGLAADEVAERLKDATGYDGELVDMPKSKLAWLDRKLDAMPDVDPETGEIVEDRGEPDPDDAIPF
jgi:hypothetical protein